MESLADNTALDGSFHFGHSLHFRRAQNKWIAWPRLGSAVIEVPLPVAISHDITLLFIEFAKFTKRRATHAPVYISAPSATLQALPIRWGERRGLAAWKICRTAAEVQVLLCGLDGFGLRWSQLHRIASQGCGHAMLEVSFPACRKHLRQFVFVQT